MIKIGQPPLVLYEEDSKSIEIKMSKPNDDLTILERICSHIEKANIKKANVCLSGGADSQFWLRILNHMNIPIVATTYLTMWDGGPVNTDDYAIANLVTQKYNIDWRVVEIDLKEFLDNQVSRKYVRDYGLNSQQIGLHLHFLDQIKSQEETLFIGGDIVSIEEYKDNAVVWWKPPGAIVNQIIPFYKFFAKNNLTAFKEPFALDNVLSYQCCKQYIEIVKQSKIHYRVAEDGGVSGQPDRLENKVRLYDSIIPGNMNTLIKVNGFERAKKLMAMNSGIYNEFDLKYRKPLENYRDQILGNIDQDLKIVHRDRTIRTELTEEFFQVIKEVDSKSKTIYLFDF